MELWDGKGFRFFPSRTCQLLERLVFPPANASLWLGDGGVVGVEGIGPGARPSSFF